MNKKIIINEKIKTIRKTLKKKIRRFKNNFLFKNTFLIRLIMLPLYCINKINASIKKSKITYIQQFLSNK